VIQNINKWCQYISNNPNNDLKTQKAENMKSLVLQLETLFTKFSMIKTMEKENQAIMIDANTTLNELVEEVEIKLIALLYSATRVENLLAILDQFSLIFKKNVIQNINKWCQYVSNNPNNNLKTQKAENMKSLVLQLETLFTKFSMLGDII